MKAILKYTGAKNRIAEWICSFMPQHSVYVEPYAGSLAVFFAKQPAKIETLDDLDGDVVNYFRVIRENPEELCKALRNTPYARDEYHDAFISRKSDTDVERARKFAVRCWQGIGCSNVYRNGFRSSQQSSSPHTTKVWRDIPDRLAAAHERLLNAQIENLPALEIIRRYDTPDVFMYIDPPYLHGTRKDHLYRHEMCDAEHRELLEAVMEHPGKIIISGYDNDMYNNALGGWSKASIRTRAEAGLKRMETIWMNFEQEGQQMRFDI